MRNSPRVDVIVPYGHSPNQPERQANLQQVLESLQNDLEYENFRVILAELGPRETQRALARSLGADYVFTNSDEEFSPGRAMNAGFLSRQQPADLVYFHQADFLVARDVLDRAVQVKLRLECPFVYPYWGEVHLSRIVSEAVRRAVVQPGQLFDVLQRCVADRRAAEGSEQAASDAYDEVTLSNDELESLVAVLPAGLRREITEADQLRLWGADDRSYAPYRWRPEETLAARLCRISGGPVPVPPISAPMPRSAKPAGCRNFLDGDTRISSSGTRSRPSTPIRAIEGESHSKRVPSRWITRLFIYGTPSAAALIITPQQQKTSEYSTSSAPSPLTNNAPA